MTTGNLRALMDGFRFMVRWLASMFCFGVFGLGGLLFGLVLVPLVTLFTRDPERRVRRLRWWLQQAFRGFVGLMSGVRGASFEVHGARPAQRNYLIVANHPTLFDAVVLLALFPQVDCIVKHELLRNPFTRLALSGLDYISNADTATMLQTGTERLRQGRSLLVFPEGTRSRPREPLTFRLAAATMAVRAGVDCLPVVVHCHPQTRSKAGPWYEIAPQKPHYAVYIEEPVDVAAVTAGHAPRYAKRVLNDFLQGYYNQRLYQVTPTPLSSESGHYSSLA